MNTDPSVLLLTRPKAKSEAFRADLQAFLKREIVAVISPVLEVIDFGPIPDLTDYKTIILTSQHATERLGKAGLLLEKTITTVGEETARFARGYGADARALGSNASDFLEQAHSLVPPCLHCRGVHTRGDIARHLSEIGIETDEVVIYDQKAKPLSDEAMAIFAEQRNVVLPLFSPRTSRILSEQIPASAQVSVIAMSDAIAKDWSGPGEVVVAAEPTAGSMLHSVASALS